MLMDFVLTSFIKQDVRKTVNNNVTDSSRSCWDTYSYIIPSLHLKKLKKDTASVTQTI